MSNVRARAGLRGSQHAGDVRGTPSRAQRSCYHGRMTELDDILRREARDTLRRELPGLEEAVPLAPLCAYGVGGPAEYLYRAGRPAPWRTPSGRRATSAVPLTVLGRATNVLVGDARPAGLTVLARNEAHTLDGELLMVEAGAELPGLVTELAEQGLAGLEFAGNIPGSVGGAVVGNAGAYGRSMSDVLVGVHLLDGMTEHVKEPRELDFGYRTSLFKQLPELTVLSATIRLHRGERSCVCSTRSPATPSCAAASIRSSTPAAAATSRTPAANCRRRASSRTPASRASPTARRASARSTPTSSSRCPAPRPPTSSPWPRRSSAGCASRAATSWSRKCAASASSGGARPATPPHGTRRAILAASGGANPPAGAGVSHCGGRP